MSFFNKGNAYEFAKTIIHIVMVVITLTWIGYIIYTIPITEAVRKRELFETLDHLALAKKEKISSYLFNKKNELTYLANSETVRHLFTTSTSHLKGEVTEFLQLFRETKQFHDVFLIDSKGIIFWSAIRQDLIGQNLNEENANNSSLGQVYKKAKKDLGVGIYNSESSVYLTYPILIGSEKIAGKKEMIGFIVLELDNVQLEQMVKGDIGLDYKSEIYIVNRQRQNITPISYIPKDRVDSSHIRACFRAYDNYYVADSESIASLSRASEYRNYAHNQVYGAYAYILESNWCVIAEVDKASFAKMQTQIRNEKIKLQAKYLLGILVVFMMYLTLIDNFYGKIQS